MNEISHTYRLTSSIVPQTLPREGTHSLMSV